MKQHVIPKQLKEITENQFYSLFDEIVKRDDWHTYHHKKITIGKMFEILKGKGCKYINPMFYPERNNFWVIDVVFPNGDRYQEPNKELCDGLWESIKELLSYE